jgi:branched-chain amino acid transport system substrate-binding protein
VNVADAWAVPVGDGSSAVSKVTIPVLNQAGIAQVSPTDTYVGLTTDEPGSEPGEPGKYYPRDVRTFARIVPRDTVQGAAIAGAARADGCRRLRIWHSKSTEAAGLAVSVTRSAEKRGPPVAGVEGLDPTLPSYRSFAERLDADCLVWTGDLESGARQVVADATAAKPAVRIYTGGESCRADVLARAPETAASRFGCTRPTLARDGFGAGSRRFFDRYRARYGRPSLGPAVYGYEAMDLVLDAVQSAAAGGELTSAAVVDAVVGTPERQSAVGSYRIDDNGDTSLTDYGLYRVDGGELRFDRVIREES